MQSCAPASRALCTRSMSTCSAGSLAIMTLAPRRTSTFVDPPRGCGPAWLGHEGAPAWPLPGARPARSLAHLVVAAEIGLDHVDVVLDLVRRALGDDLAEVQHRDALAQAHHEAHVVLDHEDRVAA